MASTPKNRTLSILHNAMAGNYAVLAAIAYNLEHLTALLHAAESRRSPLIIQLFPSTLTQLPLLVHAAAHAVRTATVPLALHIDHVQDEAQIREIIARMPVDSVMVDMSHYHSAENLAKTRELSRECHEQGIAVEAESGRIEGSEDGIKGTGDLEALYTSPDDVANFVTAGIDILAPSIGNVHGDYGLGGPREGQIHFDRLEDIHAQVGGRVFLALHGTNDFSPELMRRCVAAGAVKLNVNKLLLERGHKALRGNAGRMAAGELIEAQIRAVQGEAERWMDVCGSSGKA